MNCALLRVPYAVYAQQQLRVFYQVCSIFYNSSSSSAPFFPFFLFCLLFQYKNSWPAPCPLGTIATTAPCLLRAKSPNQLLSRWSPSPRQRLAHCTLLALWRTADGPPSSWLFWERGFQCMSKALYILPPTSYVPPLHRTNNQQPQYSQ